MLKQLFNDIQEAKKLSLMGMLLSHQEEAFACRYIVQIVDTTELVTTWQNYKCEPVFSGLKCAYNEIIALDKVGT